MYIYIYAYNYISIYIYIQCDAVPIHINIYGTNRKSKFVILVGKWYMVIDLCCVSQRARLWAKVKLGFSQKKPSCGICAFLSVIFLQFDVQPDCPVIFLLSFSGSPVLANLPWQSCPGCPILAVLIWQSFLAVLSWPGYSFLPVLSCQSHPDCLSVIASCPGYPFLGFLFPLSCPGWPVLVVLSW